MNNDFGYSLISQNSVGLITLYLKNMFEEKID